MEAVTASVMTAARATRCHSMKVNTEYVSRTPPPPLRPPAGDGKDGKLVAVYFSMPAALSWLFGSIVSRSSRT